MFGVCVMELLVVDDDDLNESGNVIMSYEFIDDFFGMFRIEWDMGLIRICVKFDWEEDDEYLLVVNVIDGGNFVLLGYVEVKVKVIDVNDYFFWFEERIFFVSVFENVDIDFLVMILKVIDEDVGINVKFCYFII